MSSDLMAGTHVKELILFQTENIYSYCHFTRESQQVKGY
jgi:hypothetical protein